MIEVKRYKGIDYPLFQTTGFAARFAFPFAKEVCQGIGYDIGCNRLEWCFPGAVPVDPLLPSATLNDGLNLPTGEVDYIFSSHCLEHLPDWVSALEHWISRLKTGGVLFLYLPHPDQEYWRPWNNRKHIHSLDPSLIANYLVHAGMEHVFVSARDLNHSFMAMGSRGVHRSTDDAQAGEQDASFFRRLT